MFFKIYKIHFKNYIKITALYNYLVTSKKKKNKGQNKN